MAGTTSKEVHLLNYFILITSLCAFEEGAHPRFTDEVD